MLRDIPEFYDKSTRTFLGYTEEAFEFCKSLVLTASVTTLYTRSLRTLWNPLDFYVYILSAETSDHIMRVAIEAWNDREKTWHEWAFGPYAALFFEDVDTASGLYRMYRLETTPKMMRFKLVGTNLSGAETFTVTIAGDLYVLRSRGSPVIALMEQ